MEPEVTSIDSIHQLNSEFDLRILLLEVTQKCNAHCDQCGSRCDSNSEEFLTKEDILNVLQDVKEHIGTDVMINITGGEPLMRKDLFEIMAEASAMGFDWGMVTNGTLINDRVIGDMRSSGMKTITVSLDGMRYTHEELRHLPGSYDRIIQNLKKLKAAGFLDHIQVTFTSNRKNIYEFPALYREMKKIGIDSVRTSCMDLIGRAEEFKELELRKNDLDYLIDFINEINADKNNIPIIWGCPHFLNNRIKGRAFECFSGKLSASILYNGDIFVCPNVPRIPELIQGNIRQNRFSEVWKNGFQWFRNRTLPGYCSLCKYSERCRGDSVHSWNFEKNCPKFCYMDIFEPLEAKYRKDLLHRYPSLLMELVGDRFDAASIYLEPDAYLKIRRYFHMGEKHRDNRFEQQMVLIGYLLENGFVIRYVLPSDILAKNAKISIFTPETLKKAESDTQELIRKVSAQKEDTNQKDRLRFLGFIHSHPVQKELQYSTGDEKIHLTIAKKYGDYIGILVNPSLDLIGAYYTKKKSRTIRQGNLFLMTLPEENSSVYD